MIEISREETAKRAELFPQVEGQSLISDNVFFEGDKSRSADMPRRVQRERIAKRYRINAHLWDGE
ncbi:MAG: hypothetical protein WA764_02810 [Pseudolabrys sp.]